MTNEMLIHTGIVFLLGYLLAKFIGVGEFGCYIIGFFMYAANFYLMSIYM